MVGEERRPSRTASVTGAKCRDQPQKAGAAVIKHAAGYRPCRDRPSPARP
jgi:hypothetical protein